MKKIFLAVMVFVSLVSFGQPRQISIGVSFEEWLGNHYYATPQGYTKVSSRLEYLAFMADSGFHAPGYSGTPYIRSGVWTGAGQIGVDTVGNVLYFYSGGSWHSAGGGAGSGTVTSVGLTVNSIGSDVGVSGSPITSSGSFTLSIPSAGTSTRGVVTSTGTQSFAGTKVFTGALQASGTFTWRAGIAGDMGSLSTFAVGGNNYGTVRLLNNASAFYGELVTAPVSGNRRYTFPDTSGTVALMPLDSTGSPINMIYQGTDGFLHKAAVPSGSGFTNLTQFTSQGNWKVVYTDGSGDVQELALGASGTFLKSNGASSAPSFATPAGSGDVTKVGTPANTEIAYWTGDGTLGRATDFKWDPTNKKITLAQNFINKSKLLIYGEGGSTPTLIEYWRWLSGIQVARGQAGLLGGNANGAEYNTTVNFIYDSLGLEGTHFQPDTSKYSIWTFLGNANDGFGGFGVQWSDKHHINMDASNQQIFKVQVLPNPVDSEAVQYGCRIYGQELHVQNSVGTGGRIKTNTISSFTGVAVADENGNTISSFGSGTNYNIQSLLPPGGTVGFEDLQVYNFNSSYSTFGLLKPSSVLFAARANQTNGISIASEGGPVRLAAGGLADANVGFQVNTNTTLQTLANNYFNWGSTSGTSGYGIRDNSGVMEFKNSGGAWTGFGSGGGTPAGSNTQLQYNNSGAFGASANLTFASNVLTVSGIERVTSRIRIGDTDAFGSVLSELNQSGAGAQQYVISNAAASSAGVYVGNADLSHVMRFEYYNTSLGSGALQTPDESSLFTVGTGINIGTYGSNDFKFYTANTLRGKFSSAGVFRISNLGGSGSGLVGFDNNGDIAAGSVNSGYATNMTGLLKGNGTTLSVAVAGTDYATVSNIHYETQVRFGTTAALAANTYNNGTSGVGATLTGNANGSIGNLDGTSTTPSVNDRVLVKNEATQSHNGPYVVTTVGDGSNPYVLTRPTDWDQSAEMQEGDVFLITSGSTLAGSSWYQQTAGTITVGTTAVAFTQTSNNTISDNSVTNAKLATMAAHTFKMNNTGSTANPIDASISDVKTELSITNVENTALSTWTGTSNITTLGTIGTGTWQGSVISSTYGGTGVNNGGRTFTITTNNFTVVNSNQANTLTLANNLTTSGNFALTFTTTASTNITLPTTGTLSTLAGAEILTNKNVKKIPQTTASTTSLTIDYAATNFYTVTALAAGITINAPTNALSASAAEGSELVIRIKDNGTARSIAFGTGTGGFRFSSDLPAPTTTVISKTLYLKFYFNEVDNKWDCMSQQNNY